jgi:hypothetical protein
MPTSWPPAPTRPDPVIIGPHSRNAVGLEVAAVSTSAPSSIAVGASNVYATYVFEIADLFPVLKLWWYNGATASGSVEVAVYDENLTTKFATSGSLAASGTNVLQESAPVAAATLGRGRYQMVLGLSSNIQTFFDMVTPITEYMTSVGFNIRSTGVTLPMAQPLLAPNAHSNQVPLFGISQRSLVA